MDITADYEMEPPSTPDPEAWLMYTSRVTDDERAELRDHDWLTIACEHLGHGPLVIPEWIADDARLTVRERFVLAAAVDVARDADITTRDAYQAIKARIFGERAEHHARIVRPALVSLERGGHVVRTMRGGFVVRGHET